MKKIYLLRDQLGATSEDLSNFFKDYSKSNYIVSLLDVSSLKLSVLNDSSIIISVRGATPSMFYALKYAKKMRKFVVYFLDDDILNIPQDSYYYHERKKWHKKCLEICDLLLTTSKLLAEDYMNKIKTRRTVVINTPVSDIINHCRDRNTNITKIVYSASEWHSPDFDNYIKPILDKLYLKYGNSIEFYCVGFIPCLNGLVCQNYIKIVPTMCLQKYKEYMFCHEFDIGIAPLEDTYFNQRKYFNKYIEYTRYGICGIYSKVMPYVGVIRDNVNGLLVDNSADAWFEKICYAIDNSKIRDSMLVSARNHLFTHHNRNYVFCKLECDIPELITLTKENNIIQQSCVIKKYFFRIKLLFLNYYFGIKETFHIINNNIHNKGIKSTLIKIYYKFQ